MYISIAGELGSGKSTIAKIFEEKYGYKLYSTGVIQREIAKEMGMTTLELNQYMAENLDNKYDKMIDNKTIHISETHKDQNIIFDSRMAWHFVNESYKVYVVVDNYVAAERVLSANRGKEEQYRNVHEAAEGLLKRKQIEDERFEKMYRVQTTSFSNYDLVVDSTSILPEDLAYFIYERCNQNLKHEVFISPNRLFPTKKITDKEPEQVHVINSMEMQMKNGNPAIDVIHFNGFYYIIHGHHRVSAMILNAEKLIPVHILYIDQDGTIEKYGQSVHELIQNDQSMYYEWENHNHIKFTVYP